MGKKKRKSKNKKFVDDILKQRVILIFMSIVGRENKVDDHIYVSRFPSSSYFCGNTTRNA